MCIGPVSDSHPFSLWFLQKAVIKLPCRMSCARVCRRRYGRHIESQSSHDIQRQKNAGNRMQLVLQPSGDQLLKDFDFLVIPRHDASTKGTNSAHFAHQSVAGRPGFSSVTVRIPFHHQPRACSLKSSVLLPLRLPAARRERKRHRCGPSVASGPASMWSPHPKTPAASNAMARGCGGCRCLRTREKTMQKKEHKHRKRERTQALE